MEWKLKPASSFTVGGLVVVSLVFLSFLWGILFTGRAVIQLKAGQLESAARSSQRALPVARFLSGLTLHQIPDLELWRLGLVQVSQLPTTKTALTQNLLSGETAPAAISFKTVTSQAITLASLYRQSWLVASLSLIDQAQLTRMEQILRVVRDTVFTDEHTWLVVFQNSHEIRATGGFTGSYATLTFKEGQLAPIEIHDIYQPDGQFTGFVQAPPGVQEYLSSGRGLRLPDANWWPDFPKSAKQMLVFFALGKTNTVDGVLAVNLDLVKDILVITGPIYVPDYQTEVTSQNVADVLRSNRDEFFPGSVAKQHLLTSFFTSLKLKANDLTSEQQFKIGQLLLTSFRTKQLQAFSSHDELQQQLTELGWSGQQMKQLPGQVEPTDLYLYPVESNVGINKANQGISRSWNLELGTTQSRFRAQFENQTQPPLPYVNYYRLYLLPNTKVTSISYQGTAIENWDEELFTTSTGDTFTQIGFLLGLLPTQTGLLTVELSHPPLDTPASVVIQKQSGIPPVALEMTQKDKTTSQIIEGDVWIRN